MWMHSFKRRRDRQAHSSQDRVGAEMDSWLDVEVNVEKWEGGAQALSASDRRILMTIWVAEAKKKVDLKYFSLWRYFEKTGGLITADGSGDDLIQPTKLPEGVGGHSFADPVAEAREAREAAMWATNRHASKLAAAVANTP
jgi:hypothetical protein